METTITQLSPVEYELEVRATAEDIKPELDAALKRQRSQADMKGFRKGKVPMPMIKKMFGQTLGYSIAEDLVEKAFQEEILSEGDYDVLGRPALTNLDYELDGDATGTIRFGVRPEVELKDLSGEQIDALSWEVTDEDVENEVEQLRKHEADLVPLDEDEAIGEEDYLVFDVQEVDADTGSPIVGKKDEGQELFLDNPQVDQHPMLAEMKKAVLGKKPGDAVRFSFSHDAAHGDHEGHAHAHHFLVTVKDAKRRELRELDDEFVQDATDGQIETVEELREQIRKELESTWERQAKSFIEGNIAQRMMELHPVPVPDSAVEIFLDAFVKDVRDRNDDELPDNFDETYFRAQNRDEAEQQARWMLIRDKVVENEGLEVADDDRDAFLQKQAEQQGMPFEQLKGFYQQMPQVMEQLEQRLLSEKVYETLAKRFDVQEKDADALEAEYEARAQAEQATSETEEATSSESEGESPSPIITGV